MWRVHSHHWQTKWQKRLARLNLCLPQKPLQSDANTWKSPKWNQDRLMRSEPVWISVEGPAKFRCGDARRSKFDLFPFLSVSLFILECLYWIPGQQSGKHICGSGEPSQKCCHVAPTHERRRASHSRRVASLSTVGHAISIQIVRSGEFGPCFHFATRGRARPHVLAALSRSLSAVAAAPPPHCQESVQAVHTCGQEAEGLRTRGNGKWTTIDKYCGETTWCRIEQAVQESKLVRYAQTALKGEVNPKTLDNNKFHEALRV